MTATATHGKIQSIEPIQLPASSACSVPMPAPCKHTVVRVVSRHEDAEFVECMACREIFDSVEYEDIAREEQADADRRAAEADLAAEGS